MAYVKMDSQLYSLHLMYYMSNIMSNAALSIMIHLIYFYTLMIIYLNVINTLVAVK